MRRPTGPSRIVIGFSVLEYHNRASLSPVRAKHRNFAILARYTPCVCPPASVWWISG
jgi:hypothetical protein